MSVLNDVIVRPRSGRNNHTVPYGTAPSLIDTRHFVPGYLHVVPSGHEHLTLPPGIPRSPVRSPIGLIEERGILIDLGRLQLTVRYRFLDA